MNYKDQILKRKQIFYSSNYVNIEAQNCNIAFEDLMSKLTQYGVYHLVMILIFLKVKELLLLNYSH